MTYYLKHHGIKGQKWGKKNGPPYPLDAEDHSIAEKKHIDIFSYSKEINKATKDVRAKRLDSKRLSDGANRFIDVRSKNIAKRMVVNKDSYDTAVKKENKKRLFIATSKVGLGILTGHPILTEIAIDTGIKTYDFGKDIYMYEKYKKQGSNIVKKYKTDLIEKENSK